MKPYTISPDRFADYFTKTVPGAYRQISTQDIRDMTNCGLIGRYGYYHRNQDLQVVIGILQYEQLRQKREKKATEQEQEQPYCCKLCGEPLPPEPEGKRGRPREYCDDCESKRAKERNSKWRKRRKAGLSQLAV